jgi:hypothetical protein
MSERAAAVSASVGAPAGDDAGPDGGAGLANDCRTTWTSSARERRKVSAHGAKKPSAHEARGVPDRGYSGGRRDTWNVRP